MHSVYLLSLNDTHNSFWLETLNILCLFTGKLHREPLICFLCVLWDAGLLLYVSLSLVFHISQTDLRNLITSNQKTHIYE